VVVVPGAGDTAAAAGAAFVQALGAPDRRLDVSMSAELRASDLRGAAAVVFIDTRAAPLPSPAVRRALQRFVHAGGGVLALGSSAGGYSGWPWWRRLVAGPPCHRAGKTARVVVDPGGAIATDWAGAPEQTLVARALAWSVGLSEARPC
jgi:hypothetical protein